MHITIMLSYPTVMAYQHIFTTYFQTRTA